ncbi:MAG TPA: extracellular solute-binding protein [Anaerolineae bacterium]|nr:extracellular solute-binding protein [Anaerolineae bacterium]
MKENKRFLLLLASGLVTLSLVLAACAPPTPVVVEKEVIVEKPVVETVEVVKEVVVTATPVPPGPVTIAFWHAYNPVETTTFNEKVIPAFEEKHPNIKVEAQAVPYDVFRRKLLTAIAGGTAPDVIRSDIIWVPELAEMGALVALDELMPDFDEYKDKVFPGPLSTNYWKGHYYGLPLDTNTRILMWNKEMYEAAGISEPPKTIDEFLEACKKIKALGEDKYCFADGGTYGWAVLPWIWSFGGDITDPDLTTATGYINGPNTMAAYEFLKELLDEGYLHPGILGGGVDTAGGYARDEIANLLEGPWMPAIFEAQFPEKEIHWSLMPVGKGGSISVVGGEDIVMFQQSKHKEEAAEFIRFMLSPEVQLTMAEVGQVPVRADITDEAIEKQPYFALFFEQLKTAKARLPHPNWPKIEDLLTSTGQAILRGEKSAQEALDELAPKVDRLLATE